MPAEFLIADTFTASLRRLNGTEQRAEIAVRFCRCRCAQETATRRPVAPELARVVAKLVEAVGAVGEVEGGEDGVVDLLGGPAADVTAAMQEHFEQADDAGVVHLDAGIADRADGDRHGEALQQREVDLDVEPLRLETGEASGDGLEALADGIEVVQSLLEVEVGEVVGDQLVAQEGGELFVLSEEGVLEVGAEDMMAVLDAIDDGGQPITTAASSPSVIGQLVLFSIETGDAWLLDPVDRLAVGLARDGESEPIHIEETDTTFAIGWKGRYRIDGPAFVYSDLVTGRVTTVLGYPTDKLSQIA